MSPGIYYLCFDGTNVDGELRVIIQLHASLPTITDIGTHPDEFSYTNTQNTSMAGQPYYDELSGQTTPKGVYYKLVLTRTSTVSISHDSPMANTYITVVSPDKDRFYNYLTAGGTGHASTTVQWSPGTYYIVSMGKDAAGEITTHITVTIDKTIVDTGSFDTNFEYSHTGDTSTTPDGYCPPDMTGKPSKDIFYRFTLNAPMRLTVQNTASFPSSIYIVQDASPVGFTSPLYTVSGDNPTLKTPTIPAGTYYAVVEGMNGNNGTISTRIKGKATGFLEASNDQNYVLTTQPTQAVDNVNDLNLNNSIQTIQYFDGLGHPMETVQAGASPTAGGDLVTYQEYDNAGRASNTWLPVVAANNNGAFIPFSDFTTKAANTYINETKPYAKPVYEASPLNRIVEQYGPGQAWHDNHRSVKSAFLTNEVGNDTLNCILYEPLAVAAATDTLVTITNAGNYATAQLFVTRTEDEDGNASLEFKDKQGKVVLIRQINDKEDGTKETFDTYYIYDLYGNKVAVLPPEASDRLKATGTWTNANSAVLRDYAFLYLYDGRNRNIAKRQPGQQWTYYVYDTADHLVFTQTGNLRAQGKWMFTLQDAFDRDCLTGLCSNPLNPFAAAPLASVVKTTRSASGTFHGYTLSGVTLSNPVLLDAKYYDDYAFIGANGFPASSAFAYDSSLETDGFGQRYTASSKTMLTGEKIARLDNGSTPTVYDYTVNYYDYRHRLIQTKSTNQLWGYDLTCTAYDFTGHPTKVKHVQTGSGKPTQTELYTYTYDNMGRLLTTKHKLNAGSEVTLVDNVYDELGRLKSNRRNGDTQGKLKTDYAYNVRSWTKSINNPLFKETLYYNDAPAGTIPVYNGNVSAMDWSAGETKTRRYGFTYDALSRLTAANYSEVAAQTPTAAKLPTRTLPKTPSSVPKAIRLPDGQYIQAYPIDDPYQPIKSKEIVVAIDPSVLSLSEALTLGSAEGPTVPNYSSSYSYDKHGNITHLTRHGNTHPSRYGLVDNVSLTYQGNQLLSAEDVIPDDSVRLSMSADFKDKVHNTVEYAYDANGNQTMDSNSGITSIEYNLLNLPKKITFAETGVSNEYVYSADGTKLAVVHKSASGTEERTDYVGNMVYKKGTLDMIQVDGGYIKDGQYYFYLQDHLGSNRVVANATGTVVQRNHYYPYGVLFAESYQPDKQPFKYIGKELDTKNGLNWTDFSARFMNGRQFLTQDPLAEKYYSWSPYSYCKGNPIRYVDLKGDSISVTELYARNQQGELINPNQVKAFEFLVSTKEGKALLANYASKGQTIAGVSFNKDGKYHSQGINLSLGAGTRDQAVDGSTTYSLDGENLNNRVVVGNSSDTGDLLDTFVHEITIHADQNSVDFIDDKVMNNSNAYPALRNMNGSRGYTQHWQERNVNRAMERIGVPIMRQYYKSKGIVKPNAAILKLIYGFGN
ncbi:MAG: DUF6443 domain-containing protein [Mediterranea sp.]|nr:DUF6443 domain-containing protein [Mediterranea sp.]